MITNERRATNGAGFFAASRRAGAIVAPSAFALNIVVPNARATLAGQTRGRLFGVTKPRLLRLAGRNNDWQLGQSNACEQALG